MMRIRPHAWIAALALAAGCGARSDEAPSTPGPAAPTAATASATAPDPATAEPSVAAARKAAGEAAARLTEALMTRLTKALGEGGPERAVSVCADVAQDVTVGAAGGSGATVRRTALRLRNPVNAPDDFERAALLAWSQPGAAREPITKVLEVPGGRELRLLKPIVLQPLCVTCHGPLEEIPAPVRAAIAARYPEDKATSFQAGDLRGAVSVRVPIEGAGAR